MYDDEGFLPEELDELEREFVEAVETGPPLEEEDEDGEEEEDFIAEAYSEAERRGISTQDFIK